MTHIIGAVYTKGKAIIRCESPSIYRYIDEDFPEVSYLNRDHEMMVDVLKYEYYPPKEDAFSKLYLTLKLS